MKIWIVKFSSCAVYGKITAHWLTSAIRCHLDKSEGQCRVSVGFFTSIFWPVKSFDRFVVLLVSVGTLQLCPDEITSLLTAANVTPITPN